MNSISIKVLSIGIALLLAPRAGHAWCAKGPLATQTGTTLRHVPVYLHASSSSTTFLGHPINQAETAIRAVVNTWWEEGNANVRPYYAGRTTNTDPTGRVIIRQDTSTACSRCTGSVACEYQHTYGSHRIGSTLWFETPQSCFPTGYGPWTMIPREKYDGFRFALLHELGHALGLLHPFGSSSGCPAGGWTPTSSAR